LSTIRAIDPHYTDLYNADKDGYYMRRSKETFKFTREMGARLRELRLKAGVTQQELAVLMGRQGKGNAFLISRFENGHVPYPSFGFVADYLRACRASFADIADLLEAYTSQPTVIEQRGYKRVQSLARKLSWRVAKAVEKYDHGVTRAKLKPVPPGKRLKNAQAYASTQEAQHRLSRLVEAELSAAGVKPASADAAWSRVYARKLWRLLSRSKDERKLKPRLEELDRWAAEVGIEALPVLATLRERVSALLGEPSNR
jgi:transcriptional regulator with XRE-family HTH domain